MRPASGRTHCWPRQLPAPWHGVGGAQGKPSGVGTGLHSPPEHRCAKTQSTEPQTSPSGAGASVQPFSGRHTATRHERVGAGHFTGVCTQPMPSAHESLVQTFPSSHERGEPTHTPERQTPRSRHSLAGMQASPS